MEWSGAVVIGNENFENEVDLCNPNVQNGRPGLRQRRMDFFSFERGGWTIIVKFFSFQIKWRFVGAVR